MNRKFIDFVYDKTKEIMSDNLECLDFTWYNEYEISMDFWDIANDTASFMKEMDKMEQTFKQLNIKTKLKKFYPDKEFPYGEARIKLKKVRINGV